MNVDDPMPFAFPLVGPRQLQISVPPARLPLTMDHVDGSFPPAAARICSRPCPYASGDDADIVTVRLLTIARSEALRSEKPEESRCRSHGSSTFDGPPVIGVPTDSTETTQS